VLVDLWIKGFSSVGNRSAQEKDPNRIRRLDQREVRGPTKSLGVHAYSVGAVVGIVHKGSPPVQNQLRLAAGHGKLPVNNFSYGVFRHQKNNTGNRDAE